MTSASTAPPARSTTARGRGTRGAVPAVRRGEATEESEALAVLSQLAHRRFGRIPADALARHVLRLHGDADWPVQRAAMEALIRRWKSGQRDALKVARRPQGKTRLGRYETRRPRDRARPYRTWLEAIEPIDGSCDCPDFPRSSLGLCKHLLIVLDDIAAKPRRWEQALGGRALQRRSAPRLRWEAVRPLRGKGDWLERVHLSVPPGSGGVVLSAALGGLRRRFRRDGSGDGWRLRDIHDQNASRRLALVKELLAFGRRSRATAAPSIEPASDAAFLVARDATGRVVSRDALPLDTQTVQWAGVGQNGQPLPAGSPPAGATKAAPQQEIPPQVPRRPWSPAAEAQ